MSSTVSETRPKHERLVSPKSVYMSWSDALDLAMKVGVPCVPGTPGPVANYMDGAAFVEEHGFPGMSNIGRIALFALIETV